MSSRHARRALPALLLSWLILALCALPARAGEVILTLADGRKVQGRITIETPEVLVIDTGAEKVTVKVAEIVERAAAPSAQAQFEARVDALELDDVEGWKALARWCRSRGLAAQEEACWRHVQEVAPEDAEAAAALEPEPEAGESEAQVAIRAALQTTTVHFDFPRATIETLSKAIASAAEVSITIDESATKELERKRMRLRYKSDASALRALEDITTHTGLSYLVTDAGVVIGTPGSINALRKSLGLKERKAPRMSPEEARRIFEEARITLSCREKPLRAVLTTLRKDTALRYFADVDAELLERDVSFECVQEPLSTLLPRVLAPLGLDVMLQGPLVYIAPKERIEKLREPMPESGEEGS